MELTKEQIQKIENFLDDKEIDYVDIRFEVLDHIISDIEQTQTTEKVNFDETFNQSSKKWQKELEQTSSFITGGIFVRPRLVIKKAVKIFTKWSVMIFLVPILLMFLIPKNTIEYLKAYFDTPFYRVVFLIVLLISVGLILFCNNRIAKTNKKSTYRFIFEKQVFITFLLTAPLVCLHIYRGDAFMVLIFLLMYIMASFLGFSLYKKHIYVSDKFSLAK